MASLTIQAEKFLLKKRIGCLIGMRIQKFRSFCVIILLVLDMQSLVDVAREEAERRRLLEQQGIKGRVIEGNGTSTAPSGNITTSIGPSYEPEKTSARSDSSKNQASLRRYQATLKKLDREIQKTEDRLASKRARLQKEKWAPVKLGRSSGSGKSGNSQSQLQSQIDELQLKLKQLRDERYDVWESGKKAGFLPGELEGRFLH
ncbi:MAG: hypothetical protein JXA73_13435 [Acidobacteria bacterium]|nr:hypothetical protein [Acidobacteriota bacterium]